MADFALCGDGLDLTFDMFSTAQLTKEDGGTATVVERQNPLEVLFVTGAIDPVPSAATP